MWVYHALHCNNSLFELLGGKRGEIRYLSWQWRDYLSYFTLQSLKEIRFCVMWRGRSREEQKGRDGPAAEGHRPAVDSNDLFLHNMSKLLKCSLTSHSCNSNILTVEWRREKKTSRNDDHHHQHHEGKAGLLFHVSFHYRRQFTHDSNVYFRVDRKCWNYRSDVNSLAANKSFSQTMNQFLFHLAKHFCWILFQTTNNWLPS